jgi:hypothetical protein
MEAVLGMRSSSVRLVLALSVCAAASQAAAAGPLTFEAAFGAGREPAGALHYQAMFVSKGLEHTLEVWRDGDRRIKRRTDDVLETYAFHEPASPEFRMSVVDLKKRIHTRIDRTNLGRLGNFTDWFELAHALRHPTAEYHLVRTRPPAKAPKPVDRCLWYEMTQDQRVTRICWSSKHRIPLLIQEAGGEAVWRVRALDRTPIAAAAFEVHDEGFVLNDANADIAGD